MKQNKADNLWDFLGRSLPAAALICGGIMGLLLALASWIYLAKETAPFISVVFYLAVGLAVAAAAVFLCRIAPARNEVRFCICLAVAAFVIRGLFVLLVPAEPVSDFQIMYDAACELARGNNIMNDNWYFQWWSYQSAFVAWMALWIRLFGAGVFFFQMTNCLFGAGCAVLVYALAKRFASPQGARTAGILYLLYPGSVFLAPVLTNQHLSELLLLTALYIAAGEKDDLRTRVFRGGAAGLVLALSNAIRPSAVVVVLAVLALLILELFRWKELGRSGLLPAAAGALAIVAVYFLAGEGISLLFRVTGLNRNGLTNNIPQWKFILGLNTESGGAFNWSDNDAVFGYDQLPQIQEAARQLLKERLSDLTPGRLLTLFQRKIRAMWGSFEPIWWAITQNVADSYAARGQTELLVWWQSKLERLSSGINIASSLLLAVGCIKAALKKEKGQNAALLLALTCLAYFCVHLFIEVQARYRTLLFAAAIPLTAIGADWLGAFAERLLKRRKEKRKET